MKIEIFKVGTHTDASGQKISFTEEMLQDVVDAYNPDQHEAPLVIGHPKDNTPAYGWVKNVSFADGSLNIEAQQVDDVLTQFVEQGKFKKISASFYMPNSPTNPTPGKLHLRHVGFLGAQPPAVKGLKAIPVDFSEEEEGIADFSTFDEEKWALKNIGTALTNIREFIMTKFGKEIADDVLPHYTIDSIKEASVQDKASFSENPKQPEKENKMGADNKQADFAEQQEKLEAERAAFEAEKADFAEQQQKQRNAENEKFVEDLVKGGQLPPANAEGLTNFMEKLNHSDVVSFGEGQENEKTALDYFKDFMAGLPKAVEFNEKAPNTGNEHVISFSAPNGYQVDQKSLELMAKAEAYAKENNVSVDEAYAKLEG